MKKASYILILISIFSYTRCVRAQDNYDHLIFPDPDYKIVLVKTDDADRSMLSGVRVSPDDPLFRAIMTELESPFHKTVVRLNQCSRNLSSNLDGPNVLFLSGNQGGFPRTGLILSDGENLHEYPNLNYVDLVIDETRMKQGEMYIFSHELGHVMMNNIWPEFGETATDNLTTKQHVSMGITDYYTAMFEGWAIHFEYLAYSRSGYDKHFEDSYKPGHIEKTLWHSNIDRSLRINSVLGNEYIFQKAIPQNTGLDESDLEQLILLYHTSPMFDKTKLRNAQQMLSSEGFVATLFLKINTDETLQQNYQPREFYQKFLVKELPDAVKLNELFSPFENVVLKSFQVWQNLKKTGEVKVANQPILAFVEEWCRSFPEDKEAILTLFIQLSAGKTVSNEPGEQFIKMASRGLIGDYFVYRDLMQEYRELLAEYLARVITGEITLDANLGPELWIRNDQFLIRSPLWSDKRNKPLAVNMNTASVYEMAAVLGISLQEARKLIMIREEKGFFTSLDQIYSGEEINIGN